MDGIAIALVSPTEVTVLCDKKGAFKETEVAKVLKRYKSTVKESSQMSSLPL